MCGFAGFFGFKDKFQSSDSRLEVVGQMGRILQRRGPDDQQTYDNGQLTFVFRRLSIVDLNSGRQPIWNEDKSIFISVNGEIYNHKELRALLKSKHHFSTNSDSEIVLHLYEEFGPDCLKKLIGMFAIVIWDEKKGELFLARDRMGIKPLYYSETNEGIVFGSELKSLLAFPGIQKEFQWSVVNPAEFRLPRVFGGRVPTYIKGIEFLPGGSYTKLKLGEKVVEKRFWDIENYFSKNEISRAPDYYVEEYSRLIEDSVYKRLMSDVPVGSFLSGGLDSALVTAIASRRNKDLHCFHILDEAVIRSGDTEAAQNVAKISGIPFHPVLFNANTFLDEIKFDLEKFEYFIWMMDSPRLDLEWLFKHELHRYAKSEVPGLKVILLGQGSDEFAGGYSNELGGGSWENYVSTELKMEAQRAFQKQEDIPVDLLPFISEERFIKGNSIERNFQLMAISRVRSLQAYNLWHEDRTSSAQGIESRVPFLDHRLVEFLVSIPGSLQKDLFWDKKIVRAAALKWLPKNLVSRPKIQFNLTKDRRPVNQVKREIIKRVYPEFKEKYSSQSDFQFSFKVLDHLFELSQNPEAKTSENMDSLIGCMSIASFINLTKTVNSNFLNTLLPQSPLKTATENEAKSIFNVKEWEVGVTQFMTPKRWTDADRPIIGEGVKINLRLPNTLEIETPEPQVFTFDLDGGLEWILRLLQTLSLPKYEPLTIRELHKKLKVPIPTLRDAIKTLGKQGVLVGCKLAHKEKKRARAA